MRNKYTLILLLLGSINYSLCSYDAIINLGGDCQVAWQLAINDLRAYALPFDWIIAPFDSMYKLIEHKFENFLTKDSLVITNNSYISDTLYGTSLLHDFLPTNLSETYDEVKIKYNRRIRRFATILTTSKKILFIRKEITKEQAINLDQLLQRLYPNLNYTILALATHDEIKENWQQERIQNFYLRQPEPYDWTGDHNAWKEIFKKFDIQLTSPSISYLESKRNIDNDDNEMINIHQILNESHDLIIS